MADPTLQAIRDLIDNSKKYAEAQIAATLIAGILATKSFDNQEAIKAYKDMLRELRHSVGGAFA